MKRAPLLNFLSFMQSDRPISLARSFRTVVVMLLLAALAAPLSSFAPTRRKLPAPFELKTFEKGLMKIPAGLVNLAYGRYQAVENPPTGDWQAVEALGYESSYMELTSFYISATEVTNAQYVHCLDSLQLNDPMLYSRMLPDTQCWSPKAKFMDPMVDYYLRHPAYCNYPVVGITHKQAQLWCTWMTDFYNTQPKRKFKQVEFRLPTLAQWEHASRVGSPEIAFPWGTDNLQAPDGKWMANFKRIDQSTLRPVTVTVKNEYDSHDVRTYYAGQTSGEAFEGIESFETTVKVRSFEPNKHGLYNTSGNVEEYVAEYGFTKGGSWEDTGFFLQQGIHQRYTLSNPTSRDRGFRFVMTVIQE